jgi:hypothetical protein
MRSSVLGMAPIYPTPRFVRFATGDLSDARVAAKARDRELPETIFANPQTVVLDLSGHLLSPSALLELVLPIGRRIKGGIFGEARFVVVTSDPATQELVGLLAKAHEIPLFLATSSDWVDVGRAVAAGDITSSERETLEHIRRAGGQVTSAMVASIVDIEPSAATNRLVNLERKGYVYRFHRDRRTGDLFVDPRLSSEWFPVGAIPATGAPPLRANNNGEDFDPFSAPSLSFQAETGEPVG